VPRSYAARGIYLNLFRPVDTNALQGGGWQHRLPHVVVFAVVALLYALGGLDWLEHKLMDSRFAFTDRPATGTAVHVGIDSRSIRDLKKWPWPRRYHADLIRRLDAAGASRIVLDIDLSSSSTEADDEDLAAAIKEAAGKVVLPVFKQRAPNSTGALVYTEPLAAFLDHAQTASNNVRPEADSLVRRYNRIEPWQAAFVPSLATQLVGKISNNLEPFFLDFGIRPESIIYYSYVDILSARFPPASIKGKTVFVGATAVELGDMLAVPIHGALSGSMLQIIAYESEKMGRTIERSAPAWSFATALLLALLLGPCFSAWSWQRGLAVTVGAAGSAYVASVWLQFETPVSADISLPVLVLTLSYVWSLVQQLDVQSIRMFKQHMAAVHRRALMNSVVNDSFEGIIIANADGRIDFVNPAACRLLGLRANDITGQNILRFLRAGTASGKDIIAETSETDTHVLVKSETTEIEAKDGTKIPIEYSTTLATLAPGSSPLERRTDTRPAYIYTFRDLRESVKAEAALRMAADKAIAADRAKSELLANVSHELRTPLNAIIGFSNMMDIEMFGPLGHTKYNEYTKDILYSGEHLLELVNNILSVSRMDSGNYELTEEYLVISDLVNDCWHLIEGSPEARRITMDADIPDNLPQLFADARSLKQIIINLIGNAVKFTPAGGTVRALARFEPTGEIFLTIADNGIGISPGDLQHITEPFKQVEGAMQREYGGVGLGLHIVSRLVALHDAHLEVQSELGVGTKMTIRFPRGRVEGLNNVIPLSDRKSRGDD